MVASHTAGTQGSELVSFLTLHSFELPPPLLMRQRRTHPHAAECCVKRQRQGFGCASRLKHASNRVYSFQQTPSGAPEQAALAGWVKQAVYSNGGEMMRGRRGRCISGRLSISKLRGRMRGTQGVASSSSETNGALRDAGEHVCVACSAPEQHQQCTHSAHLCRITGCAGQCRCGLPPPCGVQTAAPARLCTRRGACVRLCGCECMAFEGRRRLCMGNGRMAGMQYCQYIIN